jgi:hypothetical protein
MLQSLRSLYLKSNQIGDEGIRAVARSPHVDHLSILDLRYNPIHDAGGQALLESGSLRRLSGLGVSPLGGLSQRMMRALQARFGPLLKS